MRRVTAANADVGADSIALDANSTYTLTISNGGTPNENASATGDLDVSRSLTISGPAGGTATTIIEVDSPTLVDRVIEVRDNAGITLNLNNLTIRDGLSVTNTDGGGIFVNGNRNLNLNSVVVTNNEAQGNSFGGGIAHNSPGTATLTNSVVSNNKAGGNGAGIRSEGPLTITDSTVRDNSHTGTTARTGGGILHLTAGSMTLTDSTVSGNTATGDGGGIWTTRPATLTNVTVTNNAAGGTGSGGGMFIDGNISTLLNATISHNVAGGSGDGIRRQTGTARLRNTIVANNDDGGSAQNCSSTNFNNTVGATNAIVNETSNLDNGTSCSFGTANNSQSSPSIAGLGSLQNNGGPTFTRALGSNSDALDAGSNPDCPAEDQRGVARPQPSGGQCDIGAYESDAQTITVDKDFSDDGSGEVTITLTCESGTVTDTDNTATEGDDAEFSVSGFTSGDTCDASEGTAPAGYSKNESDCQDLVLGTDTSCQIVNTTTTTITVDKDFSDNGSGEVTVTLTCDSGTVTNTDNTATEGDDAEFKVDGFTPGDTCDASEGAAPAGYSKDESDCEDLVLGTDTSCQIVNTTTTTITVDKDFSDDGSGEVTITLTCDSGVVTEDDNTATESDDATFTVDGFTPGDECDASEDSAPAGYTKDESDCQDLVLGTDTGCEIENVTTTTITVDKDFSDDGSGEVTITLTCDSGDVTEDDNTATESDDATFTVDGFTPGDTCDASEGAAPTGYSKDESDCQDLVLGTDTGCDRERDDDDDHGRQGLLG